MLMVTLDEPVDCLEVFHRLDALHTNMLSDEKHGVDPAVVLESLSGSHPR